MGTRCHRQACLGQTACADHPRGLRLTDFEGWELGRGSGSGLRDSQEWHYPQTMKTGSELHIHSATLNAGGDWTDDGSVRNGRLVGVRDGELPTITYRRAWINARRMAPTAAEQAHGGHACISYWRRLAHRLVDRDLD